jgi:hypothetical protein
LIPSLAGRRVDRLGCRGGREDEVDCESTEGEELLDGEGEALLMLGVVRRSIGADEEMLDEVEGEVDRLVVTGEVLEDDGGRLPRRDLESIGIQRSEDADALERSAPDLHVVDAVLDRCAEEHLDETSNALVERVSRRERLQLRDGPDHERLELLQRLENDDVGLALDPGEEVRRALLERPSLAHRQQPPVGRVELGDPAEVGDVLYEARKVLGVVDDDVVECRRRRLSFHRRELGPQSNEGRRGRADEGSDLVELEGLDERRVRFEGDPS